MTTHAPIIPGEPYDRFFRDVLLPMIRKTTQVLDNDYLLVMSGATGTGKTTLGFHALHLYMPEPSLDFVALSRDKFAQSIKLAKESPPPRYTDYDEGDVNKRDAMTRWNRDIIRLYGKIRGLNIFHQWKHPYPDMLDKHQAEEVINGFIWICTTGNPRRYYFFTKRSLGRFLEKFGNLKPRNLAKGAEEFANWKGWFRKYDGPLWKEYLEMKSVAMGDAVEEFFEAHGRGATVSGQEASRRLGVHENTLYRYANLLLEDGRLPVACRTASGQWRLRGEDLDTLRVAMQGE